MKTYTVQVKYTMVVKVKADDTETAVIEAMEEAERVSRSGECEVETNVIHIGR